ncbi:hypothetical protein [Serratia marcescens]|uniref:hypothetical protein n=1 Tax=Serratia TaxID=613 RepID=UPI0011235D23|nr:hypothetical protein [Serratia marcescens]MDP8635162.1 hypothetical protein [Serratia marcescens]MDP8868662.1 hypothetical protein [Serratia marcescens]HBL7109603.1 hypothetical protein [Serratia marcescens]HBL7331638.1 hypothetical protein [Serratia marcescens]HEJ8006353.1 hypothetical protein [Serratia marcescens]
MLFVTTADNSSAASYEAAFLVDEPVFSSNSLACRADRGAYGHRYPKAWEVYAPSESFTVDDVLLQCLQISAITGVTQFARNYHAEEFWSGLGAEILHRANAKNEKDVTYKAGMSVADVLAAMMPSNKG